MNNHKATIAKYKHELWILKCNVGDNLNREGCNNQLQSVIRLFFTSNKIVNLASKYNIVIYGFMYCKQELVAMYMHFIQLCYRMIVTSNDCHDHNILPVCIPKCCVYE